MVKMCPCCGYNKLTVEKSPNGGELFVGEDYLHLVSECYDPDIVEYYCETCKEGFYAREN